MDRKPRLVLAVDYGQNWPLSDVMWAGARPDWKALLPVGLIERLEAWARFFNEHANWETGLFGDEQRRKWFDLEGVRLLADLRSAVGDRFDIELNLWF